MIVFEVVFVPFAVFDSSTLILLAKIGLLPHALDLKASFLVPEKVYREVVVKGKKLGKEDALIVDKLVESGKIRVAAVSSKKQVNALLNDFRINQGEAEAVALALEKKALFLGADDREAIKACRVYGLPFVTALSMAIKLSRDKKISKEEVELALLKLEKFGFYSKEIMDEGKKECGSDGKRGQFSAR